MNTPYEFGYEIGRLVKRADADDDALEYEKEEVRNLAGWNGPGRNAVSQDDVDAANAMRTGFNRMKPSAGGAGRGGMAPGPVQVKPTVKPALKPTVRPAPMRPAPNLRRSGLPKLPSGPTSSPDFNGAVE